MNNMTRLTLLTARGVRCALAPTPPRHAAPAQPNIVIFLVDDMGVMDTSVPFLTDAAGQPKRYPLNDFYRTPNMERLAARGIRFNNFCAMSVCSPTRISIMTGQNAARHRTTNWINPDKDNAGPFGPPEWNWQGLEERRRDAAAACCRRAATAPSTSAKATSARASPKAPSRRTSASTSTSPAASIGAPGSYYGMQNYGNAAARTRSSRPAPCRDLEKYHGTGHLPHRGAHPRGQVRTSPTR